jgi:phage N-6-adenine-methyltransferase
MVTNVISNTPETERDTWRTPKYIFNYAQKIVGDINYDTACDRDNALATPIFNHDGEDALSVEWGGVCWCNPPYSDIAPWVEKAIASDAITVMLIPSPNGESYYANLIENSHEIAIQGRISFIDAHGNSKNGNTRGSSLFIINGYAKGSRTIVNRDDIKGINHG